MRVKSIFNAIATVAKFFALLGVAYIELSFIFKEVIRALNPNRKDE